MHLYIYTNNLLVSRVDLELEELVEASRALVGSNLKTSLARAELQLGGRFELELGLRVLDDPELIM